MPLLDPIARREYTRTWRNTNKSHVRAYNTAYRKKHARKDYDKKRFQLTGVTPEQFKLQLAKQRGRCALCLKPFGNEAPHADHDHVTKIFRGVIHRNCNVGLGYFKDDTRLLQLAIEYLNKFKIGA